MELYLVLDISESDFDGNSFAYVVHYKSTALGSLYLNSNEGLQIKTDAKSVLRWQETSSKINKETKEKIEELIQQ